MFTSTNKLDGVNDMNTLLDVVKEILEQSKSYQEDFFRGEESFADALLGAKGITAQEDDYYYNEDSCLKYRVYCFDKGNDSVAIGFIGHNDQYSSYQVTHLVHSPYYGRAMVYDIQPD
jgi:hypothetical protein